MLTPSRLLAPLLFAFVLVLLTGTAALAQVPDTTYRKPELPTGPPAPVEQPRPRPQPRVVEQPKPAPAEAAKQEEDQQEEQLRFIDKLYFGGSFGLQFGTYTNISLLPTLSYALTPRLFAGVGGVYHFQSGGGYNWHHYGGRGLLQLEMFDVGDGAVVAHAEVETLSIEKFDSERTSLAIPMVGLGYRQRISDKGFLDLLVLYNGNSSRYNPYNNPVIRVGFNIPFTSR
ncbi:hypothetical protein [Pontibacter litorisediminis]|uniref:hypothetical protein n=1 Tax=Pontibacter litorisediminis TaxID=1846260 RepID=UPI0023EB453C|nr:hypothetical protein [Pontibacter litorisediminis]